MVALSILGLLIIESQFKRKKATLIPKENFCISRWMCEGILTDCPCQQNSCVHLGVTLHSSSSPESVNWERTKGV